MRVACPVNVMTWDQLGTSVTPTQGNVSVSQESQDFNVIRVMRGFMDYHTEGVLVCLPFTLGSSIIFSHNSFQNLENLDVIKIFFNNICITAF